MAEQPDGVYNYGAPTEAVDPRTVARGVWGDSRSGLGVESSP
ncbi:DUF6009 family protein [Streptomyces sp. NPDC002825]